MKIALPVTGDTLSAHFGHCERFALYEVEGGKVVSSGMLEPPAHAPGVLPQWLRQQGVELVIAGGIGRRACMFFEEMGIRVIAGAPAANPEEIVRSYLAGTLRTGENICDH